MRGTEKKKNNHEITMSAFLRARSYPWSESKLEILLNLFIINSLIFNMFHLSLVKWSISSFDDI